MKHALALAALAGVILWLVLKPSALDKLSVPPPPGIEPATSGFVDLSDVRLPVSPGFFSVPGRHTVVIFYDASCGGCLKLDADMVDFMRLRPDVAIRKIDMKLEGDAYYSAIRNFRWKIYMAPTILIYDPKGKLVAADEETDDAGNVLFYKWLNREAERAAEKAG